MRHIRQDQIIQKMTMRQKVTIEELRDEFQVSIETIRRDLKTLEEEGVIKRVYGGAILVNPRGVETEYSKRTSLNVLEKQAIAGLVCDLINDGDTIAIDVGTTTFEVARLLNRKNNLTVLTNAVHVALHLLYNTSHTVYLLGGLLRPGEDSTSGVMCTNGLENYRVDKAIIGVSGITASFEITDYNEPENIARKKMMEIAGQVILVADYSKFGITALSKLCDMNMVDTLITDWKTPQQIIKQLGTGFKNLEIQIAEQS